MTALVTWFGLCSLGWGLARLWTHLTSPRSSANARYFVLASSFVVPALIAPALVIAPELAPVTTLRSSVVMIVTPESPERTQDPIAAHGGTEWPLASVLIAIWATGACFALTRGWRSWRSALREQRLAKGDLQAMVDNLCSDIGLRRRVRLVQSARVAVPQTYGWWHPVVMLPASAEHWPADRLEVVLRHELTHVLRHDWPVSTMASVLTGLHWFNPLAHGALLKLIAEREMACDDDLLLQNVDACSYAEHLLAVVSSNESFAVAMAHNSQLEARIRSLIASDVPRGGVSMLTRMMTAATAGVLLFTAIVIAAPQGGSAALTGTVLDASSARVPNASVVVRSSTGAMEIVRSDEAGEFSFSQLPPGEYTVEVAKRGFRLWSQSKLSVSPASAQNITAVLELGRINEVIDVNGGRAAAAPPLPGSTPTRLRVGGEVQAAKMVKSVRPAYPTHLKEAGIQGTVLMEAIVGRDGAIRDLKILNIAVNPDLAKAASEAVSQWRYEPTYLNGQPVEIVTSITVNFTLMP